MVPRHPDSIPLPPHKLRDGCYATGPAPNPRDMALLVSAAAIAAGVREALPAKTQIRSSSAPAGTSRASCLPDLMRPRNVQTSDRPRPPLPRQARIAAQEVVRFRGTESLESVHAIDQALAPHHHLSQQIRRASSERPVQARHVPILPSIQERGFKSQMSPRRSSSSEPYCPVKALRGPPLALVRKDILGITDDGQDNYGQLHPTVVRPMGDCLRSRSDDRGNRGQVRPRVERPMSDSGRLRASSRERPGRHRVLD